MKLIAHRGYWEKKHQQNTYESIFLGLIFSDGVEIDLRLYQNKIIISHDSIKNDYPILYLDAVLPLAKEFPSKIWALNIKEDGLGHQLIKDLRKYPKLKYFCFDMSFPETYLYLKKKLKIATRISDIEVENPFLSKKAIFYVQDSFIKFKKIETLHKKNIMLISPELHKKKISKNKIKNLVTDKNLHFLCTDRIADLC
jgi:glycerophosphoryl diester phosphodiesterase